MLKNILLEQILCERYQNKTKKDCGCFKVIKEDAITTSIQTALEGVYGLQAAKQLMSDFEKLFRPYSAPESRDRYSPTDEPSIHLIQPDPNLRTPRKTRVKEFGQASGQVISPSGYL